LIYTDISVDIQLILRLLLAAILGGCVGWERGRDDKPAGLRTHILVCSGAALFMLVSLYGFDKNGGGTHWDAGRIGAQIVSGIGFLGAGTILHEGLTVKGLTTAASLWIIAAVGMAIGSGMIFVGVVATTFTLITLISFRTWEKKLLGKGTAGKRNIRIVAAKDNTLIIAIYNYFKLHNIKAKIAGVQNDACSDKMNIKMNLKLGKDVDPDKIMAGLYSLQGIFSVDEITSRQNQLC